LSVRLLLSCGEPSGDVYAGALARELRILSPGISLSGLGGPQFEAAGGRLIADYRGLAVTGLTEAIAKIPKSLATLRRLVDEARREPPDALVVIDFPDFNFPLARRVRKLGIPVVYYVAPQIWAWRAGRLKTIRAIAARVLLIFPFEEQIYREARIPAEFVGHPLIDLTPPRQPSATLLRQLGFDPAAPVVAVLPGSRPNEVARILPDLVRAAGMIRARVPGAQFIVARMPNVDDDLFAVTRGLPLCAIVDGETDAVLEAADVALIASGTATVQSALHDTPMVIVYRLSPVTYRLGRPLVKVDTFGMVNLIAGERIVPELIQDAFTPAAVADEAVSMLTDGTRARLVSEGLARVRERLGRAGASRRAAEAILKVISTMRTMTVLLLMVVAAARAEATVLLPADLGDLSRGAYAIARGSIVAVDSRWTSPERRAIETVVTLRADVWLKGGLGSLVQFRVPGGRLGRYRSLVVGAPSFDAGQQVVVFLGAAPPAMPYVLGLSQGVFRIARSTAGLVVTPPAVMPVSGAARRVIRGDLSRRPLALAEFEHRVRILAEDQK
jgi:lipid-A-disaccharide synthase